MINADDKNRYPMKKKDMLEGMHLALKLAKKRLDNTKLLLESDNSYDAFILYSFSYEEFGKALIIKEFIDKNEDGLPKWLFTGNSSHERKMLRAKDHLPFKCSHFTAGVNLLKASNRQEEVTYKIWRGKDFRKATITRPGWATGRFADITHAPSRFDEITRMEFLYVNWDPGINEWHTNPDYSISELKEAVQLLEKSIIEFAGRNAVNLE
jgi:hypothetical protein